METLVLIALVVLALATLAVLATYAYFDAQKYDMNPRKWAALAFFVPFFGFFAYLFERDERRRDPEAEEMFTAGPFEVHESRADDFAFDTGRSDADDESDDES